VSYHLAVWEGDPPRTDAAAAPIFDLARWPDIGSVEGVGSPWADGPLINNAAGRLIYFAMTWSSGPQVEDEVAGYAAERGLVCFNPQTGTLM
jgi:hypothetical protein